MKPVIRHFENGQAGTGAGALSAWLVLLAVIVREVGSDEKQ
jgi:hypothetical protein